MSFAAISAFEAANLVAGERFYDLRILSETGEPLTNSLGWTMNTEPLGEGSFDTLMVGSGPDLAPATPGTVAYLREAVSTTRRITSVCIAAFTLAEAGILDGRLMCYHALVPCRGTWQAIPQDYRRNGSDLHCRRARVDVGWDDGWD